MSNKNLNTFPKKTCHAKRSISKHNKIILLSSVIVVVSILTGYIYISALSNANVPINSLQNFEITLELNPQDPKVLDLVTISVNVQFDKVRCLDGAFLNKFLNNLGIEHISLTIYEQDNSIYLQRELPIYNKFPDERPECINIDKLTISYFNFYFYKNGYYKIFLEVNGKIRKSFTREITVEGNANSFPSSIELNKHGWIIKANVTPKLNKDEEMVIYVMFEYKGNSFFLKQASMPFLKSIYIISDKGDSWSISVPSIVGNLNVYDGYKSEFKFSLGKNSEFNMNFRQAFIKLIFVPLFMILTVMQNL
jgi:hypothetical protein